MNYTRTGISDYESNYTYSPEFIDDVNMLISKVFYQWRLYEDLDEFTAFCWTKIVNSLKIYDDNGGREYGPLSTYLFQVIWNEATRIYSKHKRMSEEDISIIQQCHTNSLWERSEDVPDVYLRDNICSFAKRAYGMGIYINQKFVYKNYVSGHLTPAVKAFMWSKILSPVLEV